MAGVKRSFHTDLDILALHKELDEVSCPICMDYPHNAVLILCSSHDKCCRPYICDTSYRHSNCLDRFKGKSDSSRSCISLQNSLPTNSFNSISHADTSLTLRPYGGNVDEHYNLNENNDANFIELTEGHVETGGNVETDLLDPNWQQEVQGDGFEEAVGFQPSNRVDEPQEAGFESVSRGLKCPLCRGAILGWEVVEEARKYLNMKNRSCSRESCSFSGSYQELRRHARRMHPATRPSDIDPSRERTWRCLERQREYGDIVSAIRSAMPGAAVVGDYVIESGNRSSAERESRTGEVNASFWTTFFLFQMVGSIDSTPEARPRARGWTRHRQSARGLPESRFLWGENLLGLQDNANNYDNLQISSDANEDPSPIPRRRRRLDLSWFDDHQPRE